MDPLIKKEIEKWLHPPYDIATQEAVKKLLKENPQELADSFNGTIEFGTGGMRGKMGVGTNRLNSYTIQKATQGLANYILKTPPSLERHRIFISYDSRNHSRLFAQETAQVLAANGMEAYLTKELRPTPFVSFACRYLKCTAAVMITASHNPPEYNGYKVYWSDGAQVVFPHDQAIISEVKKIKSIETIKRAPFSHPLIHQVGSTIDEAYYAAIEKLQTFPEKNRDFGPKLHLLYSNLHGTGITLLPEAIRRWGFTSLSFVEEEKEPDGSFPNTSSPNPEQKETLKVGIDKLKQEKKDLFFATDPDADRLGVVVMHKNNPVILNGNQIAVICLFYLLKNLSKLGKLPSHSACITTIVTTDLFSLIASSFHIPCFKVLTGFKYIGEKIHEWEVSPTGYHFLFGAEESYGFLYGTHSRDKDAIISACLLSEIALEQKLEGKTLIDLLHQIYFQYGLFHEKQLSLSFDGGVSAMGTMKMLMTVLRKTPPKEICNKKVVVIKDYQTGIEQNLLTEEKGELTLPRSDVLLLLLEDESKFVIRPSGTEPKIKIYGMVRKNVTDAIDVTMKECEKKLDLMLEKLKEQFL